MNQINYQKKLDAFLAGLESVPHLFLHSCCAPCSSYVLEYLSQYMEITVFYYNPNISPKEEYRTRVQEQKRLVGTMETICPIHFVEGNYNPEYFYMAVKGHEEDKEGQERCFICYKLRLEEAARMAKEGGYDYFTTTLSISPLKNAAKLNEIGGQLAEEYHIPYLYSDFKKKNGYKHSIELSEKYGLYRQNYCGCVYSRREREEEKNAFH